MNQRIKRFFAKPQVRQLGVIISIAAVGLFSGSLVAIGGASEPRTKPTISPTPFVLPSPVKPVTLASPSPSPSPVVKAKPQPVKKRPAPAKPKRPDFNWGITIQPFPFREQNEQFLPEQLRLAAELGVSVVRIDYTPGNDAINQLILEQAKKHHLKLVFIIPFGPKDIFTDPNLYDNAYRYVADIVGKYKGQVPVWQLANEVGAVALVDGLHHGVDRVDYPEDKYKAVSTWLSAATKAVRDTDPAAKRLVTDHWVHVGFFDRFLAEGGDFEILGWNWFSDMGTNMDRVTINPQTGQTYNLLSKLKSFKKELWLTEVNRRLGSHGGKDKEQADFIQTMAEYAYGNPAINGFLVYNLVEDQTARVEESGYSLIHIDIDNKWVTGLKAAFGRYQALIKAKK